jgi:hypothetical protein
MKIFDKRFIFLIAFLFVVKVNGQSFTKVVGISPINATIETLDKPQSKVWYYLGSWYAAIPVSGGTYLYKLGADNNWSQQIKLSSRTGVQVDVKQKDDKAYILMIMDGDPTPPTSTQTASLVTIQYVSGNYTWISDNQVGLGHNVETATLDIDSQGRMWIATNENTTSSSSADKLLIVRYSDPPYDVWTHPDEQLASGINSDDICAVTAFGGNKIGVLWSNQNTQRFGFRVHNDGDDPGDYAWSTDEVPASQSAQTVGGKGMADDHINLAVASNGTIYAAIKTSWDAVGYPVIGLLVRRPNGTWDDLHPVTWEGETDNGDAVGGTRPIVLLNDTEDIVTVVYTAVDAATGGESHIACKESYTSNILFYYNKHDYIRYGSTKFNNVTSCKEKYGNDVLIMFSHNAGSGVISWQGALASRSPLAVNNGAGYSLNLSGTGSSDNRQQVRFKSTASALNNFSNLTIEAWVKPNGFGSERPIFANVTSSTSGYELTLTTSGAVKFILNTNTLTSSSVCQNNTWTHIAATYDNATMRIYINGVLDPTTLARSGSVTGSEGAIGGYHYSGGDYYNFIGSIDEVRIWNTARTADQIRANMCRTLTGSESNLAGYWRLDNPMGLTVPDLTSNHNDGSMYDIRNYPYEWSGAALGNTSAYDYTGSAGVYSASLSHPNGDQLTATSTSGSPSGIQVYRVDATTLRPGATNDATGFTNIDTLRYWGAKIIGTSSPQYSITYNYNGHPGITDESLLNLVYRDNLSDNSWNDLSATINTSSNTLTKPGLTGTEFALASSNIQPFPVELSLFNAAQLNNGVRLTWRTETEVNNYGFEILRQTQDEDQWTSIGFVNGNGNSNSPKNYSFLDGLINTSGSIKYRLKQIDNDGQYEYSKEIIINLGTPATFSLSQNYPNPFNPNTKISYTLPLDSKVSLKVFDVLGNLVETLIDERKEAGYYEVNFNAKSLSSGVYFYSLSTDTFSQTKKMILMK